MWKLKIKENEYMDAASQPDSEDLVERVKARINRMNQAAAEITKELGLPAETKHVVLSVLYGGEQETLNSAAGDEVRAENDENLKNRIYHTVEGFLNQRMKRELERFRTFWKVLKSSPVETLVSDFGKPQTAGGLGFTESSQDLAAVISTISWVIVQVQDETAKRQLSRERIVQEAQARGCSYALSNALAIYMQQQL
jgi:hypothetical protein